MRAGALALLLLWPSLALAQARAAWNACVFGDTQRVVNIDEDPTFDTVVKTQAWIDDVNDCIAVGTNAVFHVGDWIWNAQGGVLSLSSDIEWRRQRNIFLGPRSSFEGSVSFASECTGPAAPYACCTLADVGATCNTDDLATGLNGGSTALLATTIPFMGVMGNHETEQTTQFEGVGTWNYLTFNGPGWYAGQPTTFLGDATPRRYQRPDTYLGSFGDGDGNNHAFLLDLGGRNTLVIALGCGITQAEANWAVALLNARRHQPAIIVYHVGAQTQVVNPAVFCIGAGNPVSCCTGPGLSNCNDRASDYSLAAYRGANAQGGASCQTASESEGAVVADMMWNLIVAPTTNVRIVLDGHYYDSFVSSTTCTLSGVPEPCCTGAGTGNCDANTEGAVSIAPNGSTSVLEVVTDFQGLNNQTSGSGCVMTMSYSANTINTEVASPGAGTGCDSETIDARFDQEFASAQALPFDPAPCNMLTLERLGRLTRVYGCS